MGDKSDETGRSRRFRDYAEELRVIAADATISDHCEALLEAAVAYDRVAASLEAVAISQRTIFRRRELAGRETKYRCYLFDKFHRIHQAIDFEACSDGEAIDQVAGLHTRYGYLLFELWRGNKMIHPA